MKQPGPIDNNNTRGIHRHRRASTPKTAELVCWSPWFGIESTSQGRPARPLHHGNTLTLTFSLTKPFQG